MVGQRFHRRASGITQPQHFCDLVIGFAHRVIDGGRDERGNPIVVSGEGTGIVHTAPGCGDIDHVIGKKLGLPMIAPLDPEARYSYGAPITADDMMFSVYFWQQEFINAPWYNNLIRKI